MLYNFPMQNLNIRATFVVRLFETISLMKEPSGTLVLEATIIFVGFHQPQGSQMEPNQVSKDGGVLVV